MSRVFLLSASNISYTAPVTLAVRGFARPRTVPLLELAGRDGAVVPARATLAPRRGVLEGTLRAATWAAAQALLDELLGVLRDVPLQLRLGSATSRYITVYPEDVDDAGTEWPSWISVRVPLIAPDPHWHAHAQSLPNLAADSQAITNAGNANVEPVIHVQGGTGGASAISVTNATTGQTASFSGTLGAGQTLVIDCARRTATRDGVGVLTLMNQAFRTGGLRLAPGANTITRAVTGATTTFRLEYRERWH